MSELSKLPRITLTDRQLFDLEQIIVHGFAPLEGFLNEDDYKSVVDKMRLKSGSLWPIPIVFDQKEVKNRYIGEKIILCDIYGNPIAFLYIESIWQPDKKYEAQMVYGTTNVEHFGVRYLLEETGDFYIGGKVEKISRAPLYDFKEIRHTPDELKQIFAKAGHSKIVAFQTRNPIHRAHFELMKKTAEKHKAHILIHPVVGLTKEGDIDYITRVRSYKKLHEKRMKDFATLSLLPIAMRMAGPREALWHALIRKNYGATHFIVGRDHAGPGKNSEGLPFYGQYDSQKMVTPLASEIGLTIEAMPEMVYLEDEDIYIPIHELKEGQKTKKISGTQFREMLRKGEEIPEWFSFPEVVNELRAAVKKEKNRGVVVFFTGLSGSGKSTISHILYNLLLERQNRNVTLLDGDVVRQNLSKGLSFSKEDRDTNVARIGFVTSEIAKHGGIALCAVIAPYQKSRETNRRLINKNGTYIEVFVNTPLEECKKRDTKGLYEKALAGLLKNFTGIDDPYEIPKNPEIEINTMDTPAEKAAEIIYNFLKEKGLLSI